MWLICWQLNLKRSWTMLKAAGMVSVAKCSSSRKRHKRNCPPKTVGHGYMVWIFGARRCLTNINIEEWVWVYCQIIKNLKPKMLAIEISYVHVGNWNHDWNQCCKNIRPFSKCLENRPWRNIGRIHGQSHGCWSPGTKVPVFWQLISFLWTQNYWKGWIGVGCWNRVCSLVKCSCFAFLL